jgi:hypothetical protein
LGGTGILTLAGIFTTGKKDIRLKAIQGRKEDIQWLLPTSKSSAAIVARNLLLPLRSKSFFSRRVILTNRSVVFLAVRPGKQRKAAGPEDPCRSSQLFARSAAKRLRYPSNPNKADRYIAVPAIAR